MKPFTIDDKCIETRYNYVKRHASFNVVQEYYSIKLMLKELYVLKLINETDFNYLMECNEQCCSIYNKGDKRWES